MNCRNGGWARGLAAATVVILIASTTRAGAQEPRWSDIERAARGDVRQMLAAIDAAAPLVQPRVTRSAAQTADVLARVGRFRALGLSDADGLALVQHVYGRLGLPLTGEPRGADVRDASAAAARRPAPGTMRAATEFGPLSTILVRWPFDWPALVDEYVQLVEAFVMGQVRVEIRLDTLRQRDAAKEALRDRGVPLDAIDWRIENTDSVWIRDYGPQFVLPFAGGPAAAVDFAYYRYRPHDDDTPREYATTAAIGVVDREASDVVYTEGGNLAHDGIGTVIYSLRTYERNRTSPATVDQRLLSAFDASRGIVLPDLSLESTGHVDMFMKVLDEETILVGQYTPDQPDYAALEAAAAQLAGAVNGNGRRWRVVRVPQPPVEYSHFVMPVVRTYTNAQMVNNVVIVPTYGLPSDEIALSVYRSVLPGRQIIGVDARDVIVSGGAWHCVALEVPASW